VSKAAPVETLGQDDLAAATPTEAPPPASAPRPVVVPKTFARTLPSGLHIIVAPRPGTGLVTVITTVSTGAEADPADAAGLAEFTASLLTRGTRTRSATQLSETVEALGGSLSSGAGWDSSTVNLFVLAARLDDALPLYADVVQNPAFSAEEIERLRTENLNALAVRLSAPGALAQIVAGRVVFGDGPYGHPAEGTPETLKSLNPEAVTTFYRTHYVPNQTTLVFGGDITPARAFALAVRWFGGWPKGQERPAAAPMASVSPGGGRVLVVDKPDAGQAAVTLVRPGIRRADPNYAVARVANAVVGEGYSSWLNREIRIKRGLSYGASSRIDARRDGGLFSGGAQTRNDAVPEVASLLMAQVARLGTETVAPDELNPRRASLLGNYTRGLETGSGLALALANLTPYDLPPSTLSAYVQRLETVNADQIRAFAGQYLDTAQASLVIVGDGRKFLPALRQKFPNLEVIPIDQLDLNHAKLTR
jgi:zinc protease